MDACPRLLTAALASLALVALTPASTLAGGERDVCIDASEKGQELRDEGKLQSAREKFLICSREPCPPLVKADCAAWLSNVDARLPSVVISAKGADGQDIADVAVTLDQGPLLRRLDGKAITLDPGEHIFRYERSGRAPLEQRVILREGEQRRVLAVRFPEDAPGAAAPAADRPVPVAALVLGGVAIASGVVFGAFGLSAQREFDQATAPHTGCAPGCSEDKVRSIRNKEIVANVALGAGVAALAGAAVLFFTRPSVPRKAPSPAASLSIHFVPGGALAVVSGRLTF